MTNVVLRNYHRPLLLDDGDAESLQDTRCFVEHKEIPSPYAVFKLDGRKVRVHRFLLGAKKGEIVDHLNRDTLDCRRANLRITTAQGNTRNQGKRAGTSLYRGVSWDASRLKWLTQIQEGRRRIKLGRFQQEKDAAQAYDEAARERYGEDGRYNFPKSGERPAIVLPAERLVA